MNYYYLLPAIAFLLVGCGENSVIIEAKQSIAHDLMDPNSVKYRNVQKHSESVVCGEFNAKNGHGAYVGFKPFIYSSSSENYIRIMNANTNETYSLCNDSPKKFFAYDRRNLLIELNELSNICSESKISSRCDQMKQNFVKFMKKYPDVPVPKLGDVVPD